MNIRTTAITAVMLMAASAALAQQISIGKDGNIRNVDTRAMVIDGSLAYLATRGELYRTADIFQNERWEEVFALPPGENEINSLCVKGRSVFVGTRRGLFRSEDGGRKWQNVFRTIIPEKNNILSIEASGYNPKRLIICTMKGVYLSENSGSSWSDISANIRNKAVRCAALNKDIMYAAGDDGLYARMQGGAPAWERIYVHSGAATGEAPPDAEAAGPTENEEEAGAAINCVMIKGPRAYLGVNKRIIYSDDGGKSWNAFAGSGLAGTVNYILPSRRSDKLFCATTKGAFELNDEKNRWCELYKGMDRSSGVTSLLFHGDDEKSLWALTKDGLYKLDAGRYAADQYVDIEKNIKSFKIIFDNEPTIKELQQAALKFCDVSPDKIKDWQRDSKVKALVPKISFGMDRNTTDLWHWEGGSTTKAGDDVLMPGKDSVDWDATVSWDLGGLIWSDDQTNIDVRSRLNTQLRNDILDDLRRVYYERKRLQFELLASPPRDMKARFERELRIQELTQAIDDLTGNYLSENMKPEKPSVADH